MNTKINPLLSSFSFLLVLIFSISLVSATFTVSPALTSKSLVENAQVSVTVTVTNTGTSTESNVVVQLAGSPTQWFGTPLVQDCSVISSIAASQSSTSTCILRPTAVGSDLSLTATVESSGGTTGSGSTGGISVSSQSGSITASVGAPSSVDVSSTFYVSVSVTAPSSADATNVRATMSNSGACTLVTSAVPASQTIGTVSKGTTKSPSSWQFTSSSSGTCSVTVNIVSDSAGSASPSKSITVGTESPGGAGGGSAAGGGGGGGGGAVAAKAEVSKSEKEASVKISSIAAGAESSFSIDSPEIVVRIVKVKVANAVENVEITVKSLDERPSDVSAAPGVVNQYLSIESVNISDADIEKATINFKVEKEWISANEIDEGTVSLYRYDNSQWSKLETTKVGEDASNIYYDAVSPGLSLFAVSGETKKEVAPQPEAVEEKPIEIVKILSENIWILVVVLVAVVAGIIFLFVKRKGHKH